VNAIRFVILGFLSREIFCELCPRLGNRTTLFALIECIIITSRYVVIESNNQNVMIDSSEKVCKGPLFRG